MSPKQKSADIAEPPKKTVFVSYSKKDVDWRQRVQAFLETLET